jgi:hypothetical protein
MSQQIDCGIHGSLPLTLVLLRIIASPRTMIADSFPDEMHGFMSRRASEHESFEGANTRTVPTGKFVLHDDVHDFVTLRPADVLRRMEIRHHPVLLGEAEC